MCEKPFIVRPNNKTGMALVASSVAVGCGQCHFCRVNKARTWQHRILLETVAHSANAFVGLDYCDDFLPCNGNLDKGDLVRFVKRLRYFLDGRRIRYFGVGEYGERFGRPHYHIILFNVHPEVDLPAMEKAWSWERCQMGRVVGGTVTRESARYITGYCSKGWTSPNYDKLEGRCPEFMISSRGTKEDPGGIGVSGLKVVAEKLRKSGKHERYVKELCYAGGRKLPLGRYLSEKLLKMTGAGYYHKMVDSANYRLELLEGLLASDKGFTEYVLSLSEARRRKGIGRDRVYRKGRPVG